MQRYNALDELLREVIFSQSIVDVEGALTLSQDASLDEERIERNFMMLRRYQVQMEGLVRCCKKVVTTYGLHDYASELALNHEDMQVQQQLYQYGANHLKALPPLICSSDCGSTALDPSLLAKYEEAVTIDHKAFQYIYGDASGSKADACITLAKLGFARNVGNGRFESVLIHPVLPGRKGALVVSPSLLLDSFVFRFALLIGFVDR